MDKILVQDPVTRKFLPEFTPYFQRVLRPIDQWVLTEIIDDWRNNLGIVPTVEDFRLFTQTALKFYKTKAHEKHADFKWIKCILFISMQRLSRNIEENTIWAPEFIEATGRSAIDPNEEVLKTVAELYNNWRDESKTINGGYAQPYAFYLLFEVLIKDETLRKYITMRSNGDILSSYFTTAIVNGEVSIPNRLTAFAADYFRNEKQLIAPVDPGLDISSITHFLEVNLRGVNIDHIIDKASEHPAITVTTMGMMSSGKTTMIKRIKAELTKAIGFHKNNLFPITQLNYVRKGDEENQAGEATDFFGPIHTRTNPTGTDRIELAGEIRINNQQYKLLFNDIRGGITTNSPADYDINLSSIKDKEGKLLEKTYPLECLLLQTDLLLIVMDPETIFYDDEKSTYTFGNLLGDIASRLNFLFHHSKHAMIAIVFSKADEYGSVIRGPRNFIHKTRQSDLLLNYMRSGDENFLDQLNIDITSSYKGNTGMQRTVTLLMQSLRYLTDIIVYTKKHPVLNFYLASNPAIQDTEKSRWSGITDIFNDFADYFAWLIESKEQSRIAPPAEVTASVENLKVIIHYFNPNHFNVHCTVLRKVEEGEYKKVEEGKSVYNDNSSSYTDTEVSYGTKYVYKIYFSNVVNNTLTSKFVEIPVQIPKLSISPPVQVECVNIKDKITVSWKNENIFSVNVSIARKHAGSEFVELLTSKRTAGADFFIDANAEFGRSYIYKLWFLEDANPLNISTPVEKQCKTRPSKVKNIRWEIKPNNNQPEFIDISWDESRNDYPVTYKLMRTFRNDKIEDVTQKAVNGSVYKDTSVKKGFTYQYGIIVADASDENNISDPEETAEITLPVTNNILAITLITIISIILIVLLIKVMGLL